MTWAYIKLLTRRAYYVGHSMKQKSLHWTVEKGQLLTVNKSTELAGDQGHWDQGFNSFAHLPRAISGTVLPL